MKKHEEFKMSNSKSLNKQTVQNTMLIPLWARAKHCKENSDVLYDAEAIKIIENSDEDFSSIEKSFGETTSLSYIMRARVFDDICKNFIKTHPQGTIVNIGCGLDSTFSRVDNGTINWYNLDLPDAIEYRKSLIPDSERNISIGKSFFDTSWFDDIIFNEEDGILFTSSGVFYYFKEDELKRTISAMAKKFPGGQLFFDAESQNAVNKSNRMVEKTGNVGAKMYFAVNKAEPLMDWSTDIKSSESIKFFADFSVPKRWKLSVRLMIKFIDLTGMMKIVKMTF